MEPSAWMGIENTGYRASTRRARILVVMAITLGMLWVLGCELGKESTTQSWTLLESSSVTAVSAQATLIPEQGVKVSAGNVMVAAQFPANSVSEPLVVGVEYIASSALPAALPTGMTCMGAASITPHDLALLSPATITIPVTPAMTAGTPVNVYRMEGTDTAATWVLTGITAKIDASGLSATFEASKLHTFALFREAEDGPLAISAISPTSGSRGTMVAITGSGFGSGRGTSYVTFGSEAVAVYGIWSENYIQVVVPPTASSGEVRVVKGGTSSNSRPFVVENDENPPSITTASPVAGSPSTVITITGERFGLQRLGSAVYFAGVAATGYTAWTDTTIEAVVPSGASSGDLVVKVNGRSSNAKTFTVTSNVEAAPIIEAVSPASAAIGDVVTLTGQNFGDGTLRSRVAFNGMEATVYNSWTATSVQVKVPSGATSGNLVLGSGQRASNNWPYAIVQTPPAIGSLSPSSGYSGTQVTISGSNFGISQGSSRVLFGDLESTEIDSWGDSTIVCRVPSTAATGNVFVKVNDATSNGVLFTIAVEDRWDTASSPTTEDLLCLTFQNTIGWACGGDVPGTGYIMKYQSGTWTTQAHSSAKALFALAFSSDTSGWAVGGDYTGSALLSYASGTWSSVTSPVSKSLFDIHLLSSTEGWAVGNEGVIIRLSGGTWSSFTSPTSTSLFGVHFPVSTEGWAVGGDWAGGTGTILHYTGGAWQVFSSPVTKALRDVCMVSQNLGWIVGSGGTILKYSGSAWTEVASPTTMDLVHVKFTAAGTGWAVGQSGTVLVYDGTSWKRQATPTGATLRSMYLANGAGWAVGDGGALIKYGN